MTTADHVRPALQEALTGSGLVLEEVVVTPAGRRRVVKVLLDRDLGELDTVDQPTDPLSLDEVAAATRLVSEGLDTSDVMGEQPYTLEVSSAGVGRPLTEPRHYRRNVGRLVTVQHDGGEVTGRITSASATELALEVPPTKKAAARTETLPYARVERAVVQVEFNRPDESKES